MPARLPNSSSVLAGGVRTARLVSVCNQGVPQPSVSDKANDNDGLFTVPGRSQEQAHTRTTTMMRPHRGVRRRS